MASVARGQVEEFLYLEAELMDGRRFDDWIALWTTDALYWVPSERDQIDPEDGAALICDDYKRLQERIYRLKGDAAFADEPPTQVTRVISNVRFEEKSGSELDAYSNFLLAAYRNDRQIILAGRSIHSLLVEEGGRFRIKRKKVVLNNLGATLNNIVFLL